MTREKLEGFHCAVEAAIAILGGKYKAIIVWWLTESGTMRYSDIKRKIQGLPNHSDSGCLYLTSCIINKAA